MHDMTHDNARVEKDNEIGRNEKVGKDRLAEGEFLSGEGGSEKVDFGVRGAEERKEGAVRRGSDVGERWFERYAIALLRFEIDHRDLVQSGKRSETPR